MIRHGGRNNYGLASINAIEKYTLSRELTSNDGILAALSNINLCNKKLSAAKLEEVRDFVLVASNIASSKLTLIFGVTLTAGTIPYLLTYMLGDIITETYGFKRSRQLIWGAVICNLFAVLFLKLAIVFPAAPSWSHQKEYAFVLGAVPTIVIASLISYFCSEFLNAYVLAKLKIMYNGEKLWLRIIYSSIIAMTIDNFLFLAIAYWQIMPFFEMVQFSSRSYVLGLIFEWATIPVIMFIANKLKAIDHVDVFDVDTKFTPFSLDVDYADENNKYFMLKADHAIA